MDTNYFGMDSFNRDAVYCCNAVSPQTAVTAHKYVDLEGLKAYDNIAISRDISADRVIIDGKTLTQVLKDAGIILNKVDCKSLVYATSAFGLKRLKRADLNLVYCAPLQ